MIGPCSCSSSHAGAQAPNELAFTGSSRLCPATIAMPIASTACTGSRTSAASATIDQPIAQITWRRGRYGIENDQPKATTVTSSTTSHRPRVSRNRASRAGSLPLAPCSHADTPARKTNVGAQKWVTQRVAYTTAVVIDGSSGS